jgi:hypothetical protein
VFYTSFSILTDFVTFDNKILEEWFGALKVLYENAETKNVTYTLIDDLIREGGSTFWKLKEIIQEK